MKVDPIVVVGSKRNRPRITFYTEDSVRKYKDAFMRVLKKPTATRKHISDRSIKIIGDFAFYESCVCRVDCLLRINDLPEAIASDEIECGEKLEKKEVTMKKVTIDENSNIVIASGYFVGKLRLVSLPSVPKNAVLVDPRKKLWFQFCRSGFLITTGVVWCLEPIGEVKDVHYEVEKRGNEWLVRVSSLFDPFFVYKNVDFIARFRDGRAMLVKKEEDLKKEFPDGWISNLYTGTPILKRGDNYVWGKEKFPVEDFELVKVEKGKKRAFIPYYVVKKLGVVL